MLPDSLSCTYERLSKLVAEAGLRYEPSAEVVVCELDGGAALLDLRTSSYFTLNELAAQLWGRLIVGENFEEICAWILAQYEADERTVRSDLAGILQTMIEKGLLCARGEDS